MERVKNMKKPAMAVLAAALIMAVTVMGTLAYLKASQGGDKAVTNTFIAAGGGHLIDPDAPDPKPPVDPEDPDKPVFDDKGLNKGFYLLESKVDYDKQTNNYVDTGKKTLKNNYDKVAPQMNLFKDPVLVADIETEAMGYVFVKVINSDTKHNLSYEVNTADWTEVTGVTLGEGEKLYCYKNAVQTGEDGEDIRSEILRGNNVTIAENMEDINENEEGMQLGELKFEAYICQAQSFGNAAEAFNACFK